MANATEKGCTMSCWSFLGQPSKALLTAEGLGFFEFMSQYPDFPSGHNASYLGPYLLMPMTETRNM